MGQSISKPGGGGGGGGIFDMGVPRRFSKTTLFKGKERENGYPF